MSITPLLGVRIEFVGPFDGDAGLVGTAYPCVTHVSTKAGRTNELEATPPGTATVTIDNASRSFDPFNTAGPWYGNLLPNRKVTVYATVSAVEYVLWTGYTEDWPQSYTPPETADVVLPCVDALGLVARAAIPDSVWQATIKAAVPLAWYRLDEKGGYRINDSSGNGLHGLYENGIDSSTTGLLTGDANEAIDFHPNIHIGCVRYASHPELDARTSGGTPRVRTYEFWWQGEVLVDGTVNAGDGVSHKINEFCLLSTGQQYVPNENSLDVLYDDFTGLCVRTRDGTEQSTSLVTYPPQTRHHVVVYHPASDATTALVLYVDGAAATTTTYSRTPKPGPDDAMHPWQQGRATGARGLQFSDSIEGLDSGITTQIILDEVCVYDRALSAGEIADHYTAGSDPWGNDDPVTRLNNILAAAKLTGLQTPRSTFGDWPLAPAVIAGINPLEYLQRIEATESGRLVAGPGSLVDLQPREVYPDPLSVAAAFTDNPAGALHYDEAEFDTGTTFLRNSITVRYERGTERVISWQPGFIDGQCTVTDDASIALYGPRPHEINSLVSTYDDARAIALDLLARYSTPRPRVTKLVITPSADSRLIAPATTLKLGDRVTVTRHPQGVGSAFTLACHIDGIEHEVDAAASLWRTTYYLSAAATS